MQNLDNRRNIALVASAGTGKTFNLSLRYINLLLNGAQMEQILCLTFTVKATAEMQERIIQVLNALADGSRADFKGEREILREHNNLTDEELEKKARPVRDYVLKNFSQMRIRTIDSFINRIISQFPFEANVRPGFSIIQDKEKEELEAEAFFRTYQIFAAETGDTLKNAARALEQTPKAMIDEIRKQQSNFENQLIGLPVLAEKYKTDSESFTALINSLNFYKQQSIDASRTFGAELLASKLNGKQKTQAEGLAATANLKKITDTALYAACDPVNGNFKTFDYDDKQRKAYYQVIENMGKYLETKGDLMIRLSVRFYTLFFAEVERLKKNRNVLTFADITMKAYRMLVENSIAEDTEYLYFRLDGRILHILIDEFQDTSLAQWKILEPLVQQALAGVGQQDAVKSFFYVGDPKQTLYRFRGGESRLFDTVTESYSDFITEHKLDTNYRSAKAVMDFANLLFGKLHDETFRYTEQKGNSDEKGHVSVEFIEKDSNEEYILGRVKDLLERGFRAADIAVLTETNSKADTCTEYLNENGIPARSETRQKLTDSAPFKIIMNVFNHIFYGDSLNAFAFRMTGPAVNSEEEAAKEGFCEKIQEELKEFAEKTNGMNGRAAFAMAVNEFFLAERFEGDPNFKKLCDISANVPVTANLPAFFEEFRRRAESENALSAGKSDAVTVMTIHKSKGLEFEAVIISDLEISVKPNANNSRMIFYSEDGSMLADSIIFNHGEKLNSFVSGGFTEAYRAEEKAAYHDRLNLLYVAVTRAKRELYIPVKEEPTANSLEQLLANSIEIPCVLGEKYKKSFAQQPEEKKRKTEKFVPRPVPEYPITEESTDFQGEIFGTALHEAIFLCVRFDEQEAEETARFTVIKHAPYLTDEDEKRIKYSLLMLYSEPFFKEITENAEIFRERSFSDESGIKTVDFYSVKDQAVYCLDFKTGSITAKMTAEYTEQINGYADILSRLYRKPVKKYLVNFVSGRLEWIEIN
ncbi:hypothetical protein EP073_05925 [Geovibrio thiophilus]|uniref:DNA 3'-5' helicase n=1 Tax=Geovibrio thiophilus TaxID=139438 RepID=A0A3R5UYK3_9BACT|nr:UvrD-helicase domain-containing protein [Geovibrio thiophilus]QAR32961.1 hypothetical protein EP073_05925 [Geovibrio thiophilus]